MTRKTRRLIFYTFLFLFFIIASIIVLYAQGYSFNWQKKSLVLTGAFYLKSYPEKANIYLDSEHKGKTNKFIKRLPPNEYDIKISKPDYYDWQKTLKVNSKLVTEAKNILLIKKNPSINQITNYNVKYFSFSNDKKKIVYLTDRTTKEIDPTKQRIADPKEIVTYSQFALRLIDFADNTDKQVYPAPLAKGAGSIPNLKNLSKISWSNDNKKLLLSFSNNRSYILDLGNQAEIIDINNLVKILSGYKIYSIKNLSFHPQDSNKIYFLANNNLYLADLMDKSLSQSLSLNISIYNFADNEIFWVQSTDNCLYKMDLEGLSKQEIAEIPKNIQEIQFSENGKKLLWRTENKIGVIWLEPDSEQPLRKKYETEIIMKALGIITQAVWYSKTNQHIIFVVGNDIKITELDGRDKRNTINIFTVKNPEIFYNKWNGKLYILSEEQLFEIDMNN